MRRSQFLRAAGAFTAAAASAALLGCGGGSGEAGLPAAPTPAPAPPPGAPDRFRTFLYVANNASSNISVFEVAGTGILELKGTVLADGVRAVAVHPSGRFAHVTHDAGTVSVFTLDSATGMLEPTLHRTTIGEPDKLVFHPSGRLAFLRDDENVLIYTVNVSTGELTAANPLAFPGELVRGIGVDPSGRFLFVSSTADPLSSYSIDLDTGSLDLRSSVEAGVFAGEITCAPAGNLLFVQNGTAISAHAIDANGLLGVGSSVNADNISSVVVEPSGRYLYALTSGAVGSFVSIFSIGPTGNLEPKGEMPTVAGIDRLLAISRSGQFVYMTHLQGDALYAFKINQDTGALAALTPSVFDTGAEPVDITIGDVLQ